MHVLRSDIYIITIIYLAMNIFRLGQTCINAIDIMKASIIINKMLRFYSDFIHYCDVTCSLYWNTTSVIKAMFVYALLLYQK